MPATVLILVALCLISLDHSEAGVPPNYLALRVKPMIQEDTPSPTTPQNEDHCYMEPVYRKRRTVRATSKTTVMTNAPSGRIRRSTLEKRWFYGKWGPFGVNGFFRMRCNWSPDYYD